MSHIAQEIIFKLDWKVPFYIKHGKRVKTKEINAFKPNNTINHWTVNWNEWKENGASDQRVQNIINFPRCQRELYFNVKNVPIACSLSKGRPLLLNRTEALGAVQEPSALHVRKRQVASAVKIAVAPWNLMPPEPPVTRGCPAQTLPRGADSICMTLWREGCCKGRVLKWELSSDCHLKL